MGMPVNVCLYVVTVGQSLTWLWIGLCFREPDFAIVEWRLGWRRDLMPATLWQYSR